MTTVLDLPGAKIEKKIGVINLPCEKVILHNISWETYEKLLKDIGDNPSLRVFYDDGDLEIMVESFKHGNIAHKLSEMISEIADLLDIDFEGAGGTTFKKSKKKKGFEGDATFYFQAAALVRGKDELDMEKDPAPELVVEVDVTHPSLPKFPIFAALGVSEVWRYDGVEVKFYRLENDDEYAETGESICLPKVKSAAVTELLEAGFEMPRREWRKLIEKSIRE